MLLAFVVFEIPRLIEANKIANSSLIHHLKQKPVSGVWIPFVLHKNNEKPKIFAKFSYFRRCFWRKNVPCVNFQCFLLIILWIVFDIINLVANIILLYYFFTQIRQRVSLTAIWIRTHIYTPARATKFNTSAVIFFRGTTRIVLIKKPYNDLYTADKRTDKRVSQKR